MRPESRIRPAGNGADSRSGWAATPSVRDEDDRSADQLTIDVARARRDAGMTVATYATDIAWTRAADRSIAELAATGEPFTAEELRAIVGPPVGSHNAMGTVFLRAARAGIIIRVGSRQANRVEAAGRWLAMWRGTGGAA